MVRSGIAHRSPGTLLAVAMLAGCAIAQVEEPDLADIPSGPPAVVGGGFQAVGPVIVVGSGRMQGVGWRYSIFESEDGTCTQLELARFATAGCGEIEPPRESVFGSLSSGEADEDLTVVEGIIASDVSAVWVELADGRRVAAEVLSLDAAGLDAGGFIAVLRGEAAPRRAIAIGDGGEVLEVSDLP